MYSNEIIAQLAASDEASAQPLLKAAVQNIGRSVSWSDANTLYRWAKAFGAPEQELLLVRRLLTAASEPRERDRSRFELATFLASERVSEVTGWNTHSNAQESFQVSDLLITSSHISDEERHWLIHQRARATVVLSAAGQATASLGQAVKDFETVISWTVSQNRPHWNGLVLASTPRIELGQVLITMREPRRAELALETAILHLEEAGLPGWATDYAYILLEQASSLSSGNSR